MTNKIQQKTNGILSLLSKPFIYDTFQNLMGAQKGRENFSRTFIRPIPNNKIIDFGCGTAQILDFLPNIEYYGFDLSEKYIAFAEKKFKTKGKFQCKLINPKDALWLPKFDIALAIGVLHHMDNITASNLFATAYATLKDGGRLITMDPAFTNDQSKIARLLANLDRGQQVRAPNEYNSIARKHFSNTTITVRHQKWIPYTHCILECTK